MVEVRPDGCRLTMFGYNTKNIRYMRSKFGYTTLYAIPDNGIEGYEP